MGSLEVSPCCKMSAFVTPSSLGDRSVAQADLEIMIVSLPLSIPQGLAFQAWPGIFFFLLAGSVMVAIL